MVNVKKLLTLIFLLIFNLSAIPAQINNTSEVVNFDLNSDGIFNQPDLEFWIEGYKINLINPMALLYIIDSIPENGVVVCESACLLVPYFTDDELEIYLLRDFISVALGGNITDANYTIDPSYFNAKLTGFQVEEGNPGYTPEEYEKALEEIQKTKEEGSEKLVNPSKKPDNALTQEEAKILLDAFEKAVKANPLSKPYSQMTKKEKDAYQEVIENHVKKQFGLVDKDGKPLPALSIFGDSVNSLAGSGNKFAQILKKQNFNPDWQEYKTKNEVSLYDYAYIKQTYEKQQMLLNPVQVANPLTNKGTNSNGIIPVLPNKESN